MRAPANYGVYAGCKAAILAISRAAAVEWGPDGIRVNTVSPFVQSPALDADSTPDQQRAAAARLPLRRIGSPEEIGRVVAFLAGDAASYITGNLLVADGGSWHSR
jgi:NAD(P)-dependent dehydrogenase (short-subunit alcohol dehydrogenase family)